MIETPVVFIPGTLTDERVFKYQTPLFKNYKIINVRVQESLDEMLETVNQVSFEKFHLIGFSMGGYIAQEFTVKQPDKVCSLTMIASSALGYPKHEKELVLKTLPLIKPGVFKGITKKRLKEFFGSDAYQNLEIKSLIKEMAGVDAAEVYLRQLKATFERRNLTKELSEINIPKNFIAGIDDLIVPLESMEESSQSVLKSKLLKIKNCGHFITLERPSILNDILKNLIISTT